MSCANEGNSEGMLPSDCEVANQLFNGLSELPQDVLVSILLRLGVRDIAQCACACTSLRAVAMDEVKVWEPLCKRRWGATTELKKWLRKRRESRAVPISGIFFPRNYRTLSFMLTSLEPMKGLWQTKGESPCGSMYWIHWCEDGLLCSRLETGVRTLDIDCSDVLKFGSGMIATGAVLDEMHLLISDYTECLASATCSGAAAAAASVAVGSLSESGTGESPTQSHELEMQKFMNSFVLRKGRNNRRKSSKGLPGKGYAAALVPKSYHMVKVVNPKATRNTSLAGLWKGLYGTHGVEVISVEYNFTGQRAKIVGTKITGDPFVPAGERTWEVSAKSNPSGVLDYEVFSSNEDELVLNRYLGSGCIANYGYVSPKRVEGVLFEYEDGHIAFAWNHGWIDVLHYVRLDEHFLH